MSAIAHLARPISRPAYIKTPEALSSADAFERINRRALTEWYDTQRDLIDGEMPPYLGWCAVQYDLAVCESWAEPEPRYESREDYEARMYGVRRWGPL